MWLFLSRYVKIFAPCGCFTLFEVKSGSSWLFSLCFLKNEHDRGLVVGLNHHSGEPIDPQMEGIFDNYSVKCQIINSGYVMQLSVFVFLYVLVAMLSKTFLMWKLTIFFFGFSVDPSLHPNCCLWMKWSGQAATWGNRLRYLLPPSRD